MTVREQLCAGVVICARDWPAVMLLPSVQRDK
jgi:hypothetical protein